MTDEPLLPAHLQFLALRNQTPRSIRERRLAVMRTNRRMGRDVAFATKEDLKAWQEGLSHLTPSGMHGAIVHTLRFIKWVIDSGYRDDDPTRVVVRPGKVQKAMPRPMADADIGRALLTADYPLRAWIALEAFCGLRCMEVAHLTRADIRDWQNPAVLDVLGKGGKRRVVPLPERVLGELWRADIPSRGYLWSRLDGGEGYPSAMRVSERINKHLRSQGIGDTAHSLRHRFGTMLWRETKDALLVARMMGHDSVDTVKMYVLMDPLEGAAPVRLISRLAGEDDPPPPKYPPPSLEVS